MIFKKNDRVKVKVGNTGERYGEVVEVIEANNTVYVEFEDGVHELNADDVSLDYTHNRKLKFDDEGPLDEYGEKKEDECRLGFCDEHYASLNVQPMDVIAQFPIEQQIGFYRGNIIKYAIRLGHKDAGIEEATKILRYAEWLYKALAGEDIDPRE